MLALPSPIYQLPSFVRFSSAGFLALLITLAIFAMMQQLVKPKDATRPIVAEPLSVELYTTPPEQKTVIKEPPPPPPEPVKRDIEPVTPSPTDPVNIAKVEFTEPKIDSGFKITPAQNHDKMALPLVRVEPRFPTDAARDGISGWVRLGFSIDASGAVTDVTVLAAEPRNIFNNEAVRALRRWKYQPQLINGKPVKQENLQVQLDFQLQKD